MREGNSLFVRLKSGFKQYKSMILSLALIIGIIAFFTVAVNNASEKADSSALKTLEGAVTRAAVQCYAIEGYYPPDAQYLIDNYGVIVDTEKYFIYYNAFSSNNLPDIRVYKN